MSELPVGWAETTLSEITTIGPKSVLDDDLEIGFIPMSHAPTNFRDSLRYEARTWGDVKKAYTHFKNGDVIFAKVTPCFENGKAALVSGLPNGAGAGSSEFHVMRPATSEISAAYLLAVIKSAQFLTEGEENMTGAVGLRRVPRAFVEKFPVHLPPAAEQKRIAQKLDALLAQVGTLKARIDAIPALLKRFRQSVLAAAVSGRLTEIWRVENNEDAGAADLQIAKISQHRALFKNSSKAPVDPLSHEMFEIPTCWRWVSLDLLSSKIADGTHHTPTYTEHGVPFVSVKNIRHGRIDLAAAKRITKEEHAELCKRCRPEKGDLLITKSGTIGRTAVVATGDQFSLFVSVALVKPASPLVNIPFVDLALRKWVGEIDVASRIVGTAIKNLHLIDMRVLAVPFPPLAEQTEIVRRVEQLFAFADQLEAKVTTARQRIDSLTQSLLAKAFRGELVPQNPNDEPASVLLERIRAQRAAAPKSKRGRKPVSST